RSETEELVQLGLKFLGGKREQRIADVGTGSGIIAITLALETAGQNHIIAGTDISADALAIAKENSSNLGSEVAFKIDDLLADTEGPFDLIIANLPYIGETEKNVMGASVLKHEPHLALFSAKNGYAHIERLLKQAQTKLSPKGAILLEIGYTQGKQGLSLCKQLFPKAKCKLIQDLAGHDRLLSVALSI
ncbi:MAG: HemK family protein methyltransferase, partial [Chloroflexota bacterium]